MIKMDTLRAWHEVRAKMLAKERELAQLAPRIARNEVTDDEVRRTSFELQVLRDATDALFRQVFRAHP